MNPFGWLIQRSDGLGWYVLQSSGFYVAGFESLEQATAWLHAYLLDDLRNQRRDALRRDVILARMTPHGGIS